VSPSDPVPVDAVPVSRVAALGGGLIGQSWTALFLAAGRSVALFDPDPAAETRVRNAVEDAWPVLTALGLVSGAGAGTLVVHDSAAAAVEGAQFVQESVPERLDVKHALYAEIEPVLDDATVVASSASGLTLTELQAGLRDPARLVLGHPFNPPHLVPLVEVMGNARTPRAPSPGLAASTRRSAR